MSTSPEFEFRSCDLSQLDSLCDIQEEAFGVLGDERLLRRNTRGMLAACLQPPHHTVGVFCGEEMAAFGILYIGGRSEENLGSHMGLEGEELDGTANLKLFIVRPAYRGHGLQRQLIERLEITASEMGFWRLCASISPLNRHSAANFTAMGYTKDGSDVLYGGLERDIYYKTLRDGACR